MTANYVKIVIDTRKAKATLIEEIQEIMQDNPGEAFVELELHTSGGRKRLVMKSTVFPCEKFYSGIRDLGWTAVPLRITEPPTFGRGEYLD